MKTFKSIFFLFGFILTTLSFSSCLNDDDDSYSLDKMTLAIATARPISDNSYYLTLSDTISLWPAASMINFQPSKVQRVLINYTILGDNFQGYDHAIKVNRIDTILTKPVAKNLGINNDSIYGKDPVEITAMWIGDGFLNVEFKTYYSGKVKHFINLIRKEESSESPYKFEFRHNAYGDSQYGERRFGIVSFDLSSITLPDSETKLFIDVNTYSGIKTFEQKYIPGKVSGESNIMATNSEFIN